MSIYVRSSTNFGFFQLAVIALLIVSCSAFWSPECIASGAMNQGVQALLNGQWNRAIKFWTKVIRRNPGSYVAHVNRGSAYMRSGHVLKAISDWHKAKELAPVFAYAVYTREFILQNNPDNRILNYAVSLELEPNHVSSVIMTGSTYQDLGQTKKAAALYRQSIDLTKDPRLKCVFEHWLSTLESSPNR
jgi:tetratricopeptide (TPR) repeat protein